MITKKNIIHLIPTLGVGGAEKVILHICKNYDKEKYKITVIYWLDSEELLDQIKETGVEVIKLTMKKTISFEMVFKLSKILKNISADLLHTHFFDSDLIGFFSSLLCNVPQVIHIHSYPYPIETKHCIRYKIISLFCKKILCVSEIVKDHVIKKTRINPSNVMVIHNGIEIDDIYDSLSNQNILKTRTSFGIAKDAIILGNVGRLIAKKGQKYLIQAMPLVLKKYPNIKLIIVGDGPLKSDLTQLVNSLSLENVVILAGELKNIPVLLNVFDFFIFPSINESLGIAVIEAMAAGKPIIAIKDTGVSELIANNEEGLLINPENENEIADAIIYMIENPVKTKEFGLKAKEKAKMFSAAIMVSKIQNVYDEILS
ncbi:MAG: hypothetical protein A2Y03_05350 [Omnitrophica WOR_2 bacterium GWF2_38_59]|nr:MAG: hypothetical protein A2Y03_05350 [Omnitrophica WOR_2 bacterium GWF2_38_59]OGX51202.1 MAG: hypothetical protein A2243_05135 [Omnitrophica WOR_2 bacterium RIFOXYA2_FULL_38_17]OGX54615.1 MAG: hypothetical protein A2267_02095 [Omnitrophica WOR_2 bacterium RIFOXYA12_FULL_38_10]OGX55323.1 MAG: hypothetical protein A2306_06485 [Omnitrophica WOR_2 bacterium RIFOXYB2_FULL_38_16]OGX57912.1 MAG: hypothetical protein A2447_01910 [Omnitrophica WOR_2 bacterium RIFOXYC2_FULL_38_12]HBG60267.1 hypothet